MLSFHYRGLWGSLGKFTQASGIDNGLAASAYLHDPTVVAKFRIDTPVVYSDWPQLWLASVAAGLPSMRMVGGRS